MKSPSDNLHQLIRSLNSNERRYFKNYLQRSSKITDTVSDTLFDAIYKQETYDEKKLLKHFEGETLTNKFSISKSRLYELILRSLNAQYAESSVEATLKRELHYVEILFKKTLYKQAEKILKGVKKTALHYEKISTLVEVSNWEKRLLEYKGYSGNSEEELNEIYNSDSFNTEQLATFNTFWNIKSRLFSHMNKAGKARTQDEQNELKRIIDSGFGHPEKNLSVENRYIYHHTYSAYYFSINDYTESYHHLKANAELIEKHTHLFAEEPNIYFSGLSNIIFVCSQLKKSEESFLYLEKLRNVGKLFDLENNEDLQVKLFSTVNSIELSLFKALNRYDDALKTVQLLEDGLGLHGNKLNKTRKAFFYFSMSAVYLAHGKLHSALKWCNELLNDKSIDENENIKCFAQILFLLIHIDLKNTDYLPLASSNLQQYLKNKKRVYEFERAFLEFASALADNPGKDARKQLLDSLLNKLEGLKSVSFETEPFEYFDFIRWLRAKISGLPFLMVE
jgi:hypothetical protein